MVKRKSLGRGLDALLGPGKAVPAKTPAAGAKPASGSAASSPPDPSGGVQTLAVDLLQRGAMQPRHDMRTEELEDLAESIRSQGIVQPIVARPLSKGRYEIVAGERRWRAAQLAGLQDVPVIVRDLSDADAAAIAIIENIQRADLNPMEEARGLWRLKEEHDMTHQEVADAVGRSRAAVSNLLRLLDLEDAVKKMVDERRLEMGHARALLALSGAAQINAAQDVAKKGLSVRATEALVKQLAGSAGKKPTAAAGKDPDVQRLESSLSETLGASVSLEQGRGGKGKLTIRYNSLDELDGILEHIK
ncbi:MAG: ParB/RepB/Spo0J family partition protein [Gammaproteobacteria bacterium]